MEFRPTSIISQLCPILTRSSAIWYSGLIPGLRPANERRRSLQSNTVSHWLGPDLEPARTDIAQQCQRWSGVIRTKLTISRLAEHAGKPKCTESRHVSLESWLLAVSCHINGIIKANNDFMMIIGPGIILCMRPANESRRYNVTSSLIGWMHTQNDPCRPITFVWSVSLLLCQARHWVQQGDRYQWLIVVQDCGISSLVAMGMLQLFLVSWICVRPQRPSCLVTWLLLFGWLVGNIGKTVVCRIKQRRTAIPVRALSQTNHLNAAHLIDSVDSVDSKTR